MSVVRELFGRILTDSGAHGAEFRQARCLILHRRRPRRPRSDPVLLRQQPRQPNPAVPSEQQRPLRDRVLRLAGFNIGDTVRVWSEISLRDDTVNYRIDYVLRNRDRPPVIVEIMTASTSGGNKRKRTDMQSASCDAVRYANGVLTERGLSQGVNARQVWARMASQLSVKSEIANQWGGCTIRVVQDTLLAYIGAQTGLHLDAHALAGIRTRRSQCRLGES